MSGGGASVTTGSSATSETPPDDDDIENPGSNPSGAGVLPCSSIQISRSLVATRSK
ncbi:MAG: Uncharacterised protein [SAR116 cluster bacterium MED-G04]|nr:MAG: Uncharacterised protein [SAR116 cluster bacterium MED-G04]